MNYDKVAERYDDDWAGLYAASRHIAIDQIESHWQGHGRALDTIDLGIGTGNAIVDLRRRVAIDYCTGFDLSTGMLARASDKLEGEVRLVNADARDATDFVPQASQDLVLCHFILGFGDGGRLLDTAFQLLRPGGCLSLATTTRRSFSELYEDRFERYARWLGVQKSLERLSNPADLDDCRRMLEDRGFRIVAAREHRQPVCFRSIRDVRGWAVDSGWVVNGQDRHIGLRVAGGWTMIALGMIFLYPLFPVYATSEMSIVLAQKPEAISVERSRPHERPVATAAR